MIAVITNICLLQIFFCLRPLIQMIMVLFVIASASWYIKLIIECMTGLPISAIFRPSPKTRRTINIFQRHQQDINDAERHNRNFRFKNVIRSLWIPFRVL